VYRSARMLDPSQLTQLSRRLNAYRSSHQRAFEAKLIDRVSAAYVHRINHLFDEFFALRMQMFDDYQNWLISHGCRHDLAFDELKAPFDYVTNEKISDFISDFIERVWWAPAPLPKREEFWPLWSDVRKFEAVFHALWQTAHKFWWNQSANFPKNNPS